MIKTTQKADSASTMFYLGKSEERSYIIRLSFTLFEPIVKEILRSALLKTTKKYPFFFVKFSAKNNCVYSAITQIPDVCEKCEPMYFCLENTNNCSALVTYFDRTVYLEYFHGVSDGKGGAVFLRRLAAEYLAMRHNDENILAGVPEIPLNEQTVNAYRKFAKGFYVENNRCQAYKFKGTLRPKHSIKVTSYVLSASVIKQLAERLGVSVNDFMAAVLCAAVFLVQKHDSNTIKSVRISIPVNLRMRFPCRTMRNFTNIIYPQIYPKQSGISLSEICGEIHERIGKSLEIKRLAGGCGASEFVSDLAKILPIQLQKIIVNRSLDSQKRGSTLTFSNMGVVDISDELKKYICDFDMIFSAKSGCPYSCSLVTAGDKMRLNVLSSIYEPLLEKQLERVFRKTKIDFEH